MKKDKLIIFSAPSGAGKTSIVQYLLKQNLNLGFSISACSRAKRAGEKEGVDYHFLTPKEFKNKIDNNEFLEWEEVYKDNFYGTLKSEVERIQKNGKYVVFDVDVEGGLNIKKHYGAKALAIFIKPPSIDHLEERLKSRKTETPEKIATRMKKAEAELQYEDRFDIVLLNSDLSVACKEAEKIVRDFLTS
jgi:guanylate kinase